MVSFSVFIYYILCMYITFPIKYVSERSACMYAAFVCGFYHRVHSEPQVRDKKEQQGNIDHFTHLTDLKMSTAPKLKLTYFAGRGRAEVARLILAAGSVQYENVRVEEKDWPALKSSEIFFYFRGFGWKDSEAVVN